MQPLAKAINEVMNLLEALEDDDRDAVVRFVWAQYHPPPLDKTGADRVRRHREKKKAQGVTRYVTDDVTGEVTCYPERYNQQPTNQATKKPRKPPKKKNAATADEYQAKVLDLMCKALKKLNPKSTGPQVNKANLGLIDRPRSECSATVEDWARVINEQLESVRGDGKLVKYMTLSTLSIPKNFLRALDAAPPDRRTPEQKRADEKAKAKERDRMLELQSDAIDGDLLLEQFYAEKARTADA